MERERMNAGVLAPFVEKFAGHLTGLGHPRLTVTCYSDHARHFADWLCRVGIAASDVDDRVLDEFAAESARGISPRAAHRIRT